MAGSGDIRAGRSFVELYLNKSALVKDLKAVGAELKAWGDGISSVGKKLAMYGGKHFFPGRPVPESQNLQELQCRIGNGGNFPHRSAAGAASGRCAPLG